MGNKVYSLKYYDKLMNLYFLCVSDFELNLIFDIL